MSGILLGQVNDAALEALGWAKLCGELAARARTPGGRERCAQLLPSDDADHARLQLERVEEARALRRLDKEVPLADAVDVRSALGRAGRQGTLEPGELLQVARVIRASAAARRFCLEQAARAPLHAALGEGLSDLAPLATEVERAFDVGGKLVDHASALLAELRETARGLHRSIKARLEELLRDEDVVPMLRDAYYSVRGDRYVLPVRAEHRSHMPGIVHNASGSGQTLFIEPQQLVELGNALTIAEAGILEEEQRILGELSGAIGTRAPQLLADVETLAALDEVGAAARLSDDLSATAPGLVDGTSEPFTLQGLRHPLLVLQAKARAAAGGRAVRVVGNDVALRLPARGLIVSGPNAGGKTVTITAVGLAALMARAGLPICAGEGSRIPLYRTVYTAIGDEGDLSRDLSTFTAHLTSLKRILEAAGPGTLVLVDEMAADTDPREGAALAAACLEALVDAGACVLITTHLEELKALGLADPRFASASVGFDLDRLAPTFELRLGEAGASSALEIARRVGLPGPVCERARALLGGGSTSLAAAVEALELERARGARARAEVEDARAALQREQAQLAAAREELQRATREIRAGARTALLEEFERRRAEVGTLIAQLQAAPAMAQAIEAQRALAAAAEEERVRGAREEIGEVQVAGLAGAAGNAGEAASGPLRAGARVRHLRLGSDGVVLEVEGETAVVQLGALRTKVPVGELAALSGAAGRAAGKAAAGGAGFRKTRAEKMQRAEAARPAAVDVKAAVIDVRGQRVDEALRTIETELDRLLRAGEEQVVVKHGHGSGALKSAVREHLQRSPYIDRVRPGQTEEGGDGVTVALLRA